MLPLTGWYSPASASHTSVTPLRCNDHKIKGKELGEVFLLELVETVDEVNASPDELDLSLEDALQAQSLGGQVQLSESTRCAQTAFGRPMGEGGGLPPADHGTKEAVLLGHKKERGEGSGVGAISQEPKLAKSNKRSELGPWRETGGPRPSTV